MQDVTKYFHVVATLETSTTARAMSLLEAPPAAGKYGALKTFRHSDHLLPLNGLGDGKLLELMEKMLAVLRSADPFLAFYAPFPAPSSSTGTHSTGQFPPCLHQG